VRGSLDKAALAPIPDTLQAKREGCTAGRKASLPDELLAVAADRELVQDILREAEQTDLPV
jgi:hypothetical protein